MTLSGSCSPTATAPTCPRRHADDSNKGLLPRTSSTAKTEVIPESRQCPTCVFSHLYIFFFIIPKKKKICIFQILNIFIFQINNINKKYFLFELYKFFLFELENIFYLN